MTANLHTALFTLAMNMVDQRIADTKEALDNAIESANSDSKSSAGDKHETARAMAQLEQEKIAKQLQENIDMKNTLQRFASVKASKTASAGSVIYTDQGNFYLGVALGKIKHDKSEFFAISTSSPLGEKFLGKKVGDKIEFNGRTYTINSLQ